ncbi:MAG: YggS family pyridoxal phosphate-dependent enzyme [Brevinematia bacterium]
MKELKTIRERVSFLLEFIENKKIEVGITHPITIVAISKTFSPEDITEVIKAGIKDIGENRVQEAESKFEKLSNLEFTKHLVGHLQTNKINKALKIFDWIHSIDSFELAEKISKKLSEMNKTLPVLIEVNTSFEKTKFGIEPEKTIDLAGKILELKYLNLSGLMTIGPLTDDIKRIRESFKLLYNLREKMKTHFHREFPHLSMGMSDDFEIAIEEGATILRLGRIIFGRRI